MPLSKITDVKLRRLKVGQRLTETVRASGACTKFLVNPAASGTRVALGRMQPRVYRDDCTLHASFVVIVKRTVH